MFRLRNNAEKILTVEKACALFGLFMITRVELKRTFYFSFLHSLFICFSIKVDMSQLCEQIHALAPKGWRH